MTNIEATRKWLLQLMIIHGFTLSDDAFVKLSDALSAIQAPDASPAASPAPVAMPLPALPVAAFSGWAAPVRPVASVKRTMELVERYADAHVALSHINSQPSKIQVRSALATLRAHLEKQHG